MEMHRTALGGSEMIVRANYGKKSHLHIAVFKRRVIYFKWSKSEGPIEPNKQTLFCIQVLVGHCFVRTRHS